VVESTTTARAVPAFGGTADGGVSYAAVVDLVRVELADDPTVDITTTGRQTGLPRRIEIWMLDVDGRFFITGTPGQRDWVANPLSGPDRPIRTLRANQEQERIEALVALSHRLDKPCLVPGIMALRILDNRMLSTHPQMDPRHVIHRP
jgi:hypothetical protein